MPWVRDMDNLMVNKLKNLLGTTESIGIAIGRDPGIDEMAGALSLYLAITSEGKKVAIACPSDPLVEVSSLVGIDMVKKGFEADQGDLTVSFPYKEGEIEKISYTLEEGKLNILVKAGEQGLSFNENNIEYKRGAGEPKLIFVIGTPRLSDLGRVFNVDALKDSTIVNIDYKKDNQGFGEILLVNKNMSSVSEMVASLLYSLGIKIDMDIASNLMSGIIAGTDNFQSSRTSSTAFEMAAILMKNGAVRQVRETGRKPDVLVGEDAYSFFTPAKQPKKTEPKISSFIKSSSPISQNVNAANQPNGAASAKGLSEPTEDNPPDDWLAPKIYKGTTAI